MRNTTITILALLIINTVQITNACMWDRDTLKKESEGLPEVLDVITGKFDRYPPRFYTMRLERVTKELKTDPGNLELYDDAAVACDRIGESDKAIEFMAQKKIQLKQLNKKSEKYNTHNYRYCANLGTFYAHRWIKNKNRNQDKSDLQKAHDLIKQAIEINPDAHFGREKYQLHAIKWLLKDGKDLLTEKEQKNNSSHFDSDKENPSFSSYMMVKEPKKQKDAIEALSGLIVLGNAWESIDVFHALQIQLGSQQHNYLAATTQFRIIELHDAGKSSLKNIEFSISSFWGLNRIEENRQKKLKKEYNQKRENAKAWLAHRNKFLTSKLEKGIHPDTDKNFWKDYKEPTLKKAFPLFEATSSPSLIINILIMSILAILILFVILQIFKKSRRTNTAS